MEAGALCGAPAFPFARWHSASCDCHQSFVALMVREFLGVLAFEDFLVGWAAGFPDLDQKILSSMQWKTLCR